MMRLGVPGYDVYVPAGDADADAREARRGRRGDGERGNR